MDRITEKRVAMINGVTGGIGGAIAERLVADGYRVSLGARSEIGNSALNAAVEDGTAVMCAYSATDPSSAQAWADATMQAFGGIDILINCVGTLARYSLDDDTTAFDSMMEVNVKGPIHAMKAAMPHLRTGKNPKIINLVSLAGLQVISKSGGYAASKHALRAISQAVRHDGWDDGVRVTSLFPGFVNTDMVAGLAPIAPEEMTQPEDLATLVRCLIELPKTCSIAEIPINCMLDRL